MRLHLARDPVASCRPVWTASPTGLSALPEPARRWAQTARFAGDAGTVLLVPDPDGGVAGAVLGLGSETRGEGARERRALACGALTGKLPAGDWMLAEEHGLDPELVALSLLLGQYRFDRYRSKRAGNDEMQSSEGESIRFAVTGDLDIAEIEAIAAGVALARDLINTPTSDMGPAELETAACDLAAQFNASLVTVEGDALLEQNFPMIHAVGRASSSAPRLIDMSWGSESAPKVTLVGKGVCFDTGGLDIKPSAGMLLMKKDMGGAANVLGLAHMIMARGLNIRLRVLIPAVENSIAGNAFRPSDILTSRNGKTVEIGNTDAEGRLVLADALALADEEAPELLIDMATLTGAARVALGPDLPAFFTGDHVFAQAVYEAGLRRADPVWRMPLWQPYVADLASKVADTNNVSSGGFAGAITAALFLEGFVEHAKVWAHFDIYGWRPKASPIGGVGGEAYAIRALFDAMKTRFGCR